MIEGCFPMGRMSAGTMALYGLSSKCTDLATIQLTECYQICMDNYEME